MSKPSASKNKKRRERSGGAPRAHSTAVRPDSLTREPTPDSTYFYGTLMIGAFVYLCWGMVTELWAVGLIVFAALLALSVSVNAFRASMGHTLKGWKAAMARVALRWAGYHRGTDGKPLEEAKGKADARKMVIISTVVGVVIVAGLSFWLIPEMRDAVGL